MGNVSCGRNCQALAKKAGCTVESRAQPVENMLGGGDRPIPNRPQVGNLPHNTSVGFHSQSGKPQIVEPFLRHCG
jgi:hypothetical protein